MVIPTPPANGGEPPDVITWNLILSPDGSRLYVLTLYSLSNGVAPPDTLTVIDTAMLTVMQTVQLAYNSSGLAASPDGRTVYVSARDVFHAIDTGTFGRRTI